MSQLYDGAWRDSPPAAEEIGEDGQFRRIESPLRHWISPDPNAEFAAEAGRYHLFIAWVCPWASRVTAYRVLKGLEDVVSLSASHGVIGNDGWVFQDDTIPPFEVPHPLYKVRGHDLELEVPLAPWEAALGAQVDVPTLDGRVSMKVPAGSTGGQ